MAALSVNIIGVLTKLDDDAFARIKTKFQSNRSTFVNPKEHPMAGPLLQVLCDDKLLGNMDREQFAQVVEAVVLKDILELKWLGKYCDLILRTLGNVQQHTSKDARANSYANHLINTLIPDFKKTIQSSTKAAGFSEPLSFIYKITSCLLRCTAHNQYPIEISADREIMEELEKRTFKLPGNIFGSYRNEERAYVLLLSWILEEIICAEDGIEEE